MVEVNEYGQPIGKPIDNWKGCKYPDADLLSGSYCQLRRLNIADHGASLYESLSIPDSERLWTYLSYGPFEEFDSYKAWLTSCTKSTDPLFYAILDKKGNNVLGIMSYLRITEKVGVLEIGHILFSQKLQRTSMATEAIYLMLKYAFDELGYRRVEWKCDSLNALSTKAAKRLGFKYEGEFAKATIYKNRNRDTKWFAIVDSEWAVLKLAYQAWLHPSNFDELGAQKRSLQEFIQLDAN